MEQPESANSVHDPIGTSHIEIQSPSPSDSAHDPDPQPSSCHHAPPAPAAGKDEDELPHQQVENQLHLRGDEGEETEQKEVQIERDLYHLNGQTEVDESEEQLNNGESGVFEEMNAVYLDDHHEMEKEEEEEEEVEENIKDTRSNGGWMIMQQQFPVRPEAEDCSFYMKTGNCRFASNCKFNHPVKRKTQVTRERLKENDESGQIECKYYLRTGGCKYGEACRFSHSKVKMVAVPAKSPLVPFLKFNFLGLPIRLGEKECPFYMRNGSCKYGSNCRFNHPDPTVVGGNEASSAIGNGGSPSLHASSHSKIPSWSSPPPRPALNEAPPFVPIMFPPNQGTNSRNLDWNGYQAPVYPPERVMPRPPAYVMTNPVSETNIYPRHQQPMAVDEYPERPGQPDCSYFLKTGGCKYKSNCKFNHPKARITKSASCILSDKGLPLRPGQDVCAYYSRYGICKFGPACRFDHPIQAGSLDGEQFHGFSNSASDEEDHRLAEKAKEIKISN
ncbi:Zinc finger CCCH domain-containing protein 67 [Linum grandiflorum]